MKTSQQLLGLVGLIVAILSGLVLSDQGFKDVYSAIKVLTSRPRTPVFDPSIPTKVIVPSETTAILTCKVHNLGNYTVSWMRHKDLHILSVGRLMYSSDNRYEIVHRENTNEFQLHIHHLKSTDEGVYECQVSTKPITAFYINLKVTKGDGNSRNVTEYVTEEPEHKEWSDSPTSTSEILGGPDIYKQFGDMINLTCVIKGTAAPPETIYWYHRGKVISYYSNRGGQGGVSIINDKGEITVSQLLIKGANKNDEGSYMCDPSNSEDATTRVFVLDELEYSEHLKLMDGSSAASIIRDKTLVSRFATMSLLLLSPLTTLFL